MMPHYHTSHIVQQYNGSSVIMHLYPCWKTKCNPQTPCLNYVRKKMKTLRTRLLVALSIPTALTVISLNLIGLYAILNPQQSQAHPTHQAPTQVVASGALEHQPVLSLQSLQSLQLPRSLSTNPSCFQTCVVSSLGVSLIQGFEGFSPFTYSDIGGIPTIGFGHAILPGETFTQPLSGQDAKLLLLKDIYNRTKYINQLLHTPVNQNQWDALSSFTYNVGTGSLKRSALLKAVNKAPDSPQIHGEFLKWDKVNGSPSRGLHTRRQAEATLYSR